MALSCYSNWETFLPMEYSDITIAEADDSFFDPNQFLVSENPNSLLHDFSDGLPYDDVISTPTATDPFNQQLEPFPNYMQGKGALAPHLSPCDFNQMYSEPNPSSPTFFNGVVPNYSLPAPPCYAADSAKSTAAGSLSAQSVAARQRRRRITEKTQELGKLVPGGQKLNTAEMLQAAYKYIKYLQAQVAVLEIIASNNQENSSEEFQILLQSPLIQEKLYSTENCLVPQKLLEELRSDDEQSNPILI